MYLIDSDVFIQAKNLHYGFDFVPAFWDWINQAHQAGRVFTVEKCFDEILAGNDDLAAWMTSQPSSFALKPTANDQTAMATVSNWANAASQYTAGAKSTFLNGADFYLISQALSVGYAVVTQERSHPDSKARIMIPDACKGTGIPCLSPFKMLKDEGAQFKL